MSVYDRSIALAKRMIAKYGQQVQWTVAQDDQNAEPIVKEPFVVFKDTTGTFAFLRFIAGTNVSIGNVDALMAVQDFTPTLYDSIVRNGKPLSIKSLTPVQPATDVILWRIELNK